LPHDNRADELFLNDAAASLLGVTIGDTVHYTIYKYQELFRADGTLDPDAPFTPVRFTVVGTGSTLDDLLANENQDTSEGYVSPAFTQKYLDRSSFQIAGVFLRNGATDIPRFTEALNRRLGGNRVQLQTLAARERQFQDVSEPYTTALWLFGLAAAFAAVVVVVQALARVVAIDASDNAVLVALGASGSVRRGVAAGRALAAVLLGAVSAVVLAVALSPVFPLGRARRAEPDPGLRVDGLVLGLGFVAILIVLVTPVVLTAWRATRRRGAADAAARSRPSFSAERLADAGTPTAVVAGVRFAFRDPAGQRISMVATLTGLVVAIATIVAALTFGTSLERMVTTPARYGWTWNVLIDTSDRGAEREVVDAVTSDRRLAAMTIGARGNVELDGQQVSGYGLDPIRGHALPSASKGRLPQSPDEIAAGARTLHQLGKGVGDTVRATTPDGEHVTLRIVGRTALPSLALDGTEGLGEGVVFTRQGLGDLDPNGPSFFLADLAPGVSIAKVRRTYREIAQTFGPQRPGAIGTYEKVRETPLFLAGLLALLGAGVLVHLLVTSVRERRRELAVLKTIGFTRRQIATAVGAQATTVVAVALVIGIPLGLIIGRVTWSRFAANIGVVAGVVWPSLGVVAVVVAALVVGNVAAAFPARSAARTRAAVVLRSE